MSRKRERGERRRNRESIGLYEEKVGDGEEGQSGKRRKQLF